MPDRRDADPFLDTFTGLIAARAVSTAVMLGVFDALHERPSSTAELANRLGLDPLGTETLVTALVTLGYLAVAEDESVANAPVTERLLVRSSPESIATFAGEQADLHCSNSGWASRTRFRSSTSSTTCTRSATASSAACPARRSAAAAAS